LLKTKAYIEQIWRKDVSTIIEDFFSNCYENKWDGFRIYIEQESAKNATINISCYYDYLIEFLAVQKLRVKNNTDGVNSAIMSVLSSLLKRGNKTVTLSPDILLFSNLYGYAEYKKSSDKKYEDNLVSIHINQIKTNKIKLFLLKSIGTEFITTDNPYVIVNERKQKYSSEYEGLFFPISPNLCLFGSPCESISCSDMPVIAVDSVVASYVNHILKTEASKNYVSRQSDSKPQFSKTIPVGLLNRNFKDSGFH